MSTDIPLLDETVSRLPSDVLRDIAEHGKTDLFFFANGILGMKDMTERCHSPLCTFLDSNPAQFKLVLYPRDHLKTSVATIAGTMQRGVRDANSRNLIANESATNSERMLRAVRQHFEGNRVLRTVYSDAIPKNTRSVRWNDQELDLVRDGVWPEPTFDTIGMTGAVTSRHYSHMTFDDPISEEAIKSEKVMKDTIRRMSALLALLTDPGHDTAWFVGTRWALFDVYSERMKVMGATLAKCIRAVIEDGEPIWPERFTPEVIARMRAEMGSYRFSCLMMNNPKDEAIQDFNVQQLRWWQWGRVGDTDVVVMYNLDGTELHRLPLSALDITVTVDLAGSEKIDDDRNAVVVTGQTPWDEAVVLDVWAKRCTPIELIEQLFTVKQRFNPRKFGIEDVAYQKSLKYFLRQEASRRGEYFNIMPLKAVGAKEVRIKGLQPITAVGRLFVNPLQHMLLNEMSEFPLGQHDDTVDALSMHLQMWRGQLSPEQVQRSVRERKRLIRNIHGYGLLNDPGVLQLASGQMVMRADVDPEDLDDEQERNRWQNWEEVTQDGRRAERGRGR